MSFIHPLFTAAPVTWKFLGSNPLHVTPTEGQAIKITINKNTHAPRYDKESETENEVVLVIEPKETE